MNEIRIAPDLALPLDVLAMASAIFGIRNSGKTNTAVVLVEEAIASAQRSAILDPLDVWWGLKSSRDGKAPGLDVVVFGGHHGDLPLTFDQGALMARLMVENPLTGVFSLRHLRKHHQIRFAAEFLEELYHLKGEDRYRQRLFLVVDEASTFCPQSFSSKGGTGDGENFTARCVGAVEDTIRRGRNAGFGVCLVDQRPASVNKNVLSQAEMLILHRTVGPQDRDAITEYSRAHGDPEKSAEMFKTLGHLGQLEGTVGEAWVWSPFLGIFQRTRIRERQTFDSSRTPRPGEVADVPQQETKVDLEALRSVLAVSIAEAAASDPKTLKARIKELEEQLSAGAPAIDVSAEIDAATAPLVRRIDTLESLLGDAAREAEHALGAMRSVVARLTFGDAVVEESYRAKDAQPEPVPAAPLRREADAPASSTPSVPQPSPPARPSSQGTPDDRPKISEPQQRILDVLSSLKSLRLFTPSRSHVAMFAEVSPNSSGFERNLSSLRTLGLIDYPEKGKLILTDEGKGYAKPLEKAPTLAEYHKRWCKHVSGPQAAILRLLIPSYPNALARQYIADHCAVSVSSSGFERNLSQLRSLGLIDYPASGKAVATKMLFPEGLK